MTKGFRIVLGVFCLLIGFAVWSLAYGVILSLVFHDGRVLKATLTERPFLPVQQFWIYRSNHSLQIVAATATVPAVLITGLIVLIGFRPTSNPLGDASFQTMADLRLSRWFGKKGHIFGRQGTAILRKRDDRHHLVIGPTRSGKGAGYVIPNALMYEGSMIVTDLKGEIWRLTAGYRKIHGNQVFLFSPGNPATHRYNPLDFIRLDRGTRTTDIQNIASILVPENPDSENSVWQGTAQQVMAGAISYIMESSHYKDRRNLGEVNSFFNSGVNLQVLMKLIKEKEPTLSRFTVESFNAYLQLSERAAASALLDIQKALKPFKNERIVAATTVTDMDLAAMKRRPISIYLAPSIADITLLKPLLTLFVQQTMDILTLDLQDNAVPVYFLLDEFRQLGRMNEIMTKLPYVAGYGIKLAFIIQDLKNLDEIYGETSRHSLLGNCGYQMALGANDQATADYVSRALGKTTIRYQSESRTIELMGLNRRTRVEQIRERDLMMPQEVRQLSEKQMILLVEGQRPILCNKLQFFDTKPFQQASEFASSHLPEVPIVDLLPYKPVPATTSEYSRKDKEEEGAAPEPEKAIAPPETQHSAKETSDTTTPGTAERSTQAVPESQEKPKTKRTSKTPGKPPVKSRAQPRNGKAPLNKTVKKSKTTGEDIAAGYGEAKRKSAKTLGLLEEKTGSTVNAAGSNMRLRKSVEELMLNAVPDPLPEELDMTR